MNVQKDVVEQLTYDAEVNFSLLNEALDEMQKEKASGQAFGEEDEVRLLTMAARATEIMQFQMEWMGFDVSELDAKKYLLDSGYAGVLFCGTQKRLEEIRDLFARADAGEVDASMTLAERLSQGYFSKAMSVYASRYWKKAAEQGDAQAMYNYGMCFRWGEYGEWADAEQAIFWFRKAADAGYAEAENMVNTFGSSDGQNTLFTSAISGAGGFGSKWYKSKFMVEKYFEGADGGNAEMQYELARQSVPGTEFDVFKRTAKNAVKYYEMASAQGMIDAMFNLANLYRTGCPGLEPKSEKYLYWMKQCADAGDAEACYHVGREYLEDKIVPKDYDIAEEYLRKASEKGYTKADSLLRYL
ncbi:MAG: sel1 repeat family protein [Lachnospiraceae bacterium]|nr:sel1 repeat family protein [Lachnospiraceae bacterium]